MLELVQGLGLPSSVQVAVAPASTPVNANVPDVALVGLAGFDALVIAGAAGLTVSTTNVRGIENPVLPAVSFWEACAV